MNKTPTHDQASNGALGEQSVLPLDQDFSAEAPLQERPFSGPTNQRQERVLREFLKGKRLTNNDVRNIGGCLNGPDLIDRLREQGLSESLDLKTEWVACIDRDGRHVRYGEYFLTASGLAKVRAWYASQLMMAAA